jgi:hypothetical protein
VNSQELNHELVELSHNQLRKKFDREKVARLVGELVSFAEGLVGPPKRGDEDAVVEALRGLEVASGLVAEGVSVRLPPFPSFLT